MQRGAFVRLPLRFALVFGALLLLTGLLVADQAPATQASPGGPIPPTIFAQGAVYRYCNTIFGPGGIPPLCAEGPGSETLTPGAAYDTSVAFQLPWGHANFSATLAFAPPDSVLAPSTGVGSIPLGAVVGKLRSATTLGILDAPCSPNASEVNTVEVNFFFQNATTQTNLEIYGNTQANATAPEGTSEPYRDDLDSDGTPDRVGKYPYYLNKLFDPDRVGDINADLDDFDTIAEGTAETALGFDVNANGIIGDAVDLNNNGNTTDSIAENPGAGIADPYGTTEPLVPYARYSANAIVAGSAIQLEFVTFEPGQLQAFLAPHPFSELGPELGYPTIVVLTDVTIPGSPSAITDFCSPLSTYTVTWGTTRDNPCTPAAAPAGVVRLNDGFGCFNDNNMCAGAGCGNNNFINEFLHICNNEADDDGDGAANDGCPAVGPGEGAGCNDNLGFGGADSDSDADQTVDDGCPVVGPLAEHLCGTCNDGLNTALGGIGGIGGEGGATRASLPPTGLGVHGSSTNLISNVAASLRNADGDPYENNLDTCKYKTNLEDPRITDGGAGVWGAGDGDMIDPACDPHPNINDNADNSDGDNTGFPAAGWPNGQDNCPVNPNDNQREADANLPRTRSAPNGGPGGDNIGDACEGAESGSDCAEGNVGDEDGDTIVNDGCPSRGSSGGFPLDAETGADCLDAAQDDQANDDGDSSPGADVYVNDGCPARGTVGQVLTGNGEFHIHATLGAKCISAGGAADDDDRDGYCDALETALGSASVNGGVQTGCESRTCGNNDSTPGTPAANDGLSGLGQGGKEIGAAGADCTDAVDDDVDGFVNDGCPPIGVDRESDDQCLNAVNDGEADGVVNDGCFTVGVGNCSDGIDNDGDTVMDGADAGCLTPEHEALDAPSPQANTGSGPDADIDGIPDNDEPGGPADDDATNTAAGQQEEGHSVCNNDVDEDGDGAADALAGATSGNNGGAPPIGVAEPDGADADATADCFGSPGDLDRDGILNGPDNCDGTGEADRLGNFNPSQKNTDGDALGDICDTNDDGDALTDAAEYACGSRSLRIASVCEVAANGIDDDQDGTADETAVPSSVNPNVAGPAGAPANGPAGDRWANHDRDGDGWTLSQERLLGTETTAVGCPPVCGNQIDDDPCGGFGVALPGVDGWGADLSGANNQLNIADVGSFLAPARLLDNIDAHGTFNMFSHLLDDDGDTVIEVAEAPNSNGGADDPPTYNVGRWNLQLPPHTAATAINIGDLGALINGAIGSPARPPMFGGQGAFFTNGGRCPFAP